MADIATVSFPATQVKTMIDMVRRCALECGVSKDPVKQIPTAVNATEDVARITGWIINAWRDVQNLENNWRFMRRTCSFNTVAGQFSYTALKCGITENTFGRWLLDSFRVYPTGARSGEMPMAKMEWDRFRNTYQIGSMITMSTRPYVVTALPDLSLGLGPTPAAGYTVTGDYYLAPRDLASDTEEPALNAQHNRMIIVYAAMRSYGLFEGAPEVYERGERGYKALLDVLRRYELPQVQIGGSL